MHTIPDAEIFTDGACLGNPGPGGWAAIIKVQGQTNELSGGYRRTTNNRMEIMAAIQGLKELRGKSLLRINLFSDSRLLVDAFNLGWIQKWERIGWKRSAKEKLLNKELWAELNTLVKKHDVHFIWVKGHAGHAENERCDQLSKSAASGPMLPSDVNYESDDEPALFPDAALPQDTKEVKAGITLPGGTIQLNYDPSAGKINITLVNESINNKIIMDKHEFEKFAVEVNRFLLMLKDK